MSLNVGVVGASGYAGGELVRLLSTHPKVSISMVTSRRNAGKPVSNEIPILKGRLNIKFEEPDPPKIIEKCDFVFMATPHAVSMELTPQILEVGIKVVDLSGDFRLKNPEIFKRYYGVDHKAPDLLDEAVYGLPEINREKIKNARLVACPGCFATPSIIALFPLVKEKLIREHVFIDAKTGSSGAGRTPSPADHHPERTNMVRPYSPGEHRHVPEIEQALAPHGKVKVTFVPYAVDMVRGILSTIYSITMENVDEQSVWKAFRSCYSGERFIRFIHWKSGGLYRFPNPKITLGTNYCDLGFKLLKDQKTLIIFSSIDNLIKGAAGQAIQNMNIMLGYEEDAGLDFPGIYPV